MVLWLAISARHLDDARVWVDEDRSPALHCGMKYRVIDLRTNLIDALEVEVQANTPEEAAEKALGEHLVRGGKRGDIRARVYWQNAGQPMTMVRLYRRAEGR
jgi:hypothetical protein